MSLCTQRLHSSSENQGQLLGTKKTLAGANFARDIFFPSRLTAPGSPKIDCTQNLTHFTKVIHPFKYINVAVEEKHCHQSSTLQNYSIPAISSHQSLPLRRQLRIVSCPSAISFSVHTAIFLHGFECRSLLHCFMQAVLQLLNPTTITIR